MATKQQPKPHLLDPAARQRALDEIAEQRRAHQAELQQQALERAQRREEALGGQP